MKVKIILISHMRSSVKWSCIIIIKMKGTTWFLDKAIKERQGREAESLSCVFHPRKRKRAGMQQCEMLEKWGDEATTVGDPSSAWRTLSFVQTNQNGLRINMRLRTKANTRMPGHDLSMYAVETAGGGRGGGGVTQGWVDRVGGRMRRGFRDL